MPNGSSVSIQTIQVFSSRQETRVTPSSLCPQLDIKCVICWKGSSQRIGCASGLGGLDRAILIILGEAARIRWILGTWTAGRMEMTSGWSERGGW